jgi:hypothetical protein
MNSKFILPCFAKCFPKPVVIFSILLAGVFFVSGCGKKSESPVSAPQLAAESAPGNQAATADPTAVPAASQPTESAQADVPQPAAEPAPRNQATTAIPTAVPAASQPTESTQASMEVVLEQLTQALRKYSFEHKRLPGSFGEVAAAGYVKPMPQAPPGKKFAIDARNVRVVLVRQ